MTKPEPTSAAPAVDPELAPLEASFERGDFAALNEQLERLPEASTRTAAVARLRAAVSVDNAHVAVIALCALALIAIALKYF